MKKRVSTFIYILILISIILLPAGPQQAEERDANWYYDEAEKAIDKEHYEFAVKTLKLGIKKFPGAHELNIRLADLYFEKELYKLSLKEYKNGDKKHPDEFDTLNQIQLCYAYLNDEFKSIEYLEKMMTLYPLESHEKSILPVHDLAWMYIKTYQLMKGEQLLLESMDSIEEGRQSRSLLMSLATVYSGMYDFERSKGYYLRSIKDALEDEDRYFAAIGYYNLSLLEYSFYNFNSAMKYTDESLEQYDRATGHLSRGELYQLKMDFKVALQEYNEGLKTEETPLTTINIARLYSTFGMLEPALEYTEQVARSKDLTWMVNFGTNTLRHKREIHELYAEVYYGLHKRQNLLPRVNPVEEIKYFFVGIWYWLNHYYHSQLFKSYSIKVGNSYLKENNLLDAYWEFFQANENYRHIALKYLNKAGEYEIALAPKSEPYYLYEEGKILKSRELLEQAIGSFDPFWEKQSIFDSLVQLIPLLKKQTVERRNALSRAFRINPGGIFKMGYGVPLVLELNLSGKKAKLQNRILSHLKKAGSEITGAGERNPYQRGFQYKLAIQWDEEPRFVLSEVVSGRVIKSAQITTGEGSLNTRCTEFIRVLLLNYLYMPEDV